MRYLFLILVFSLIVMCSYGQNDTINEKAVRESIERQMEIYPESTLKDLYKYFFQDRYGPGHLINDTEVARKYLLKELDSYNEVKGEIIEPTGWQHNFYRVNLSVLKNELIPFDLFFDAFLQSAKDIKPFPIEKWEKEWLQMETIIESMNLSLPDSEKDSAEIKEKLKEGKYIGHHSKQFNEAYQPHYRIISRKIVEEKLLPYFNLNKKQTIIINEESINYNH